MAPDRIGRYEIQRRLGTGGMGSLYLARDPGLDRLVAIKLLKDDFQDDQDLRERFAREARSVARLRHPNIVIVFDVGEDEGRPFMAMEYIAGETLTRVLRRDPPLPLVRRLGLIEELCSGLAHAHGAGIVHRDVKPANLMLDSEDVLKILDFGIARLANSGMTQDGMMMGSVNYMSPEQIVGRGVDHRTDIFAAGAVLYEAIALEQAFPGGIDSGVLHSILEKGPIPLAQRVPDVDPELVRIVRHALEREPEKRYDDVNVMRRDIVRVRRRLLEDGHESGAVPHDRTIVTRPKSATPGTGRQGDSDRRRRMDPERFAEVRRQQVEEHLRFGREAFAKGDHDAALQHAERAATVDPDNRLAFDLIDQARFAIEAKAIRLLLTQASRLLAEGHLEDAWALADEASATIPGLEGADELRDEVRRVSDEITAARERQKRIDSSLSRARASIENGGYETALRAVYEVLALDPERPEARDLEQIAKSRLQAQRQHEQARRTAYDRLKAARTLADENKFDEAVNAIDAVVSPSDTVRLAAVEALTSVRILQRRRATDAIVAKAHTAFSEGLFEQAVSQIDAIAAEDLTDDARSLRTAAVQKLTEQRALVQRRQALEAAIAATQTLISEGSIAKAYERLQDAVGTGLDDERIAALRRQIVDLAAAAEARRREEARERAAAKRVEAARQLFDSGDRNAAVAMLERDSSGHGLVAAALIEMRETLAAEEERLRREAAIEAARLLELERQAEEKRRRDEERRLEEERRAAQEAAEKKRLEDKRQAEEKQRRDEERRLEEERRAAQEAAEKKRLEDKRQAEEKQRRDEEAKRLEEERLREAEQREQVRRELAKQLAFARERLDQGNLTGASEAAATALTLDPQNSVALKIRKDINEETQRRAAEAARQEAARKEEVRRQAEEARRRDEEERQRELEARRLEQQVTKILKKVRKVPEHEAALGLLNEALTLAPGDPRVQTLLRERNAALESLRAEEQRRAEAREKAAAEEAAQLERERLAREAQAVRERQDREARERREREEREARARHAQEEEAALAAELEARRRADAAATLLVAAPHSPQETALRGAAQERVGETILRPPRPAPRRANVAYLGIAAGVLIAVAVGVMLFQGPTTPDPEGETRSPAPVVRDEPPLPTVQPSPPIVQSLPPAVQAPPPTTQPTPPTVQPPPPTVQPAPPILQPPPPTVQQPPPTVQAPPPTVQPAPPVVPQPPPTVQPAPPTAQPAPTPVPPSANEVQPRVDERAAIEQTFRAYEGAWGSLDAEAVRRVQDFTGPDMARVRASMDAARQFQVSVQIQDVNLAADGRHATVTARVRRLLIPKSAARPADTTTTNTFTMEKRGDTWVIVTLK